MSYISHQKQGNKTYAYERENYRDKDGKVKLKSKKYLGIYDEKTKKIIPKGTGKEINNIKFYGGYYVINSIVENLGLKEIIVDIFGKQTSELIINLIIYKILSRQALYLQPLWSEDNYTDLAIDSYESSRLMKQLGNASSDVEDFFKAWSSKNIGENSLVLDITSISSHSNNINNAEYGKNKDGENLKQVNLGIIYNQSVNLPIAYRSYPGSIRDVSTVQNIVKLTKSLKMKEVNIVLDRGFYSASNLGFLSDNKLDFIISMPFSTKISQDLINRNINELNLIKNSFNLCKQTYYCFICREKIGDSEYYLYVYRNLSSESSLIQNFLITLDDIEDDFLSKKFSDLEQAKSSLKSYSRYFNITEEDDTFFISRNEKIITETINLKGKFILLSNKEYDAKDLLKTYRNKDTIEKVFNGLKTHLNEKKLKCKNETTFNGRLFVNFLTLVVLSKIRTMISDSKIKNKYTLDEIFLHLNKIKLRSLVNDQIEISEITATCKKILDTFCLENPVVPKNCRL